MKQKLYRSLEPRDYGLLQSQRQRQEPRRARKLCLQGTGSSFDDRTTASNLLGLFSGSCGQRDGFGCSRRYLRHFGLPLKAMTFVICVALRQYFLSNSRRRKQSAITPHFSSYDNTSLCYHVLTFLDFYLPSFEFVLSHPAPHLHLLDSSYSVPSSILTASSPSLRIHSTSPASFWIRSNDTLRARETTLAIAHPRPRRTRISLISRLGRVPKNRRTALTLDACDFHRIALCRERE